MQYSNNSSWTNHTEHVWRQFLSLDLEKIQQGKSVGSSWNNNIEHWAKFFDQQHWYLIGVLVNFLNSWALKLWKVENYK